MATLKGKGAMQGVNLIAKIGAAVHDKETGEIKGHFVEVQVDQSLKKPDKILDGTSMADSNPYLSSVEQQHPNGGTYVSHMKYYSESQIDAMRAGAGKKSFTAPDAKGQEHEVLGIKANVMKASDGALIVNTKAPIEPTSNPHFGRTVFEKQAAVTKAAKQARAARIEANKAAQTEKAAEVEGVEAEAAVEVEEPQA